MKTKDERVTIKIATDTRPKLHQLAAHRGITIIELIEELVIEDAKRRGLILTSIRELETA